MCQSKFEQFSAVRHFGENDFGTPGIVVLSLTDIFVVMCVSREVLHGRYLRSALEEISV